MKVYLDAGLLFTTLVETHGSGEANQILHDASPPFELNLLHHLQAENFIAKLLTAEDLARQNAGGKASRLWQRYLDEGVFQFVEPNWQDALRLSIAWTRRYTSEPPVPLLILHPALAVLSGATHFSCFDPRSRLIAKAAGLKLLPQRLEP
jgi:hypothetical protein